MAKADFHPEVTDQCTKLLPDFYNEFVVLHETLFPASYLSGKEIINKLGAYSLVFCIASAQDLIGYIYVEVVPLFSEAKIHFFGVTEQHRGKGLGCTLLSTGINWIFQHQEIDQISLCVSDDAPIALKLFRSIGFKKNHRCFNPSLST